MKIKTKKVSYDYAISHMRPLHIIPKRPNLLFRTLVHTLAKSDLKDADFSYTFDEMCIRDSPNDLGFYRMARGIGEAVKTALIKNK